MVGRLETPMFKNGPSEALSSGARFTNLFGIRGATVTSPKIGVADSAYEKAAEPLEKEIEGEPGRDVDAKLDSCEYESADKRFLKG